MIQQIENEVENNQPPTHPKYFMCISALNAFTHLISYIVLRVNPGLTSCEEYSLDGSKYFSKNYIIGSQLSHHCNH